MDSKDDSTARELRQTGQQKVVRKTGQQKELRKT